MTLAVALRRSGTGSVLLPTFVASEWADTAGSTEGDISIPKPAGTVQGDLMISLVSGTNTASPGISGDTGWTEIFDLSGSATIFRAAWKIAGASEPSSYTFTKSGSNTKLGGYIQTWRNAAFDAAGDIDTLGGTVDMPSVTATGSGYLLAFVAINEAGVGYSVPTGMTLREADKLFIPSAASFYEQITAGPTGTRTTTPDNGGYHCGVLIAIKGA